MSSMGMRGNGSETDPSLASIQACDRYDGDGSYVSETCYRPCLWDNIEKERFSSLVYRPGT